jgi:hypothetical protein
VFLCHATDRDRESDTGVSDNTADNGQRIAAVFRTTDNAQWAKGKETDRDSRVSSLCNLSLQIQPCVNATKERIGTDTSN